MPQYLSAEEVLVIHSEIIDRYGGRHGVRDLDLLASAIARPQAGFGTFEAYPEMWRKAAALFHGIIQNHPFVDGNKRTALVSVGLFLTINTTQLHASADELVDLAIATAANQISLDEIGTFFREHSSVT